MVLVAAFIPPQGSSVVDTLRGPLAPLARSARWIHTSFPMPTGSAIRLLQRHDAAAAKAGALAAVPGVRRTSLSSRPIAATCPTRYPERGS